MKKIISIVVALIIIGLAAVRLHANRENIVSQKQNIATEAVSVSVVNVERKSSSFTLNLTGTLYPYKEVDIPAETSGKITSRKFELGESFKKGSVIATIDDKIKKLTYESAKIDADRLKKDFMRIENLYKKDISSEQAYDNARIAYETSKNKMDEAERQLSYTKITAPINGTITKRNIEEGAYVNAGTPIATIMDISKLKVKVNVSETNAYYLHKGDRVKITTDIYPGATFEGRISFVSPEGDNAHNFPVEIEVTNSSRNPLKAGTFVNIEVNIGSSGTGLFIPREALQGSIKDAKVYVASNGKAVLRSITIGRQNSNYLEVVSGLSESEQVVVSGQVNLTDNKSIKIINNN
ncbi:MAG: efflux RND transporter periplasmic adaptor subunit [Ignavibacteria bacterium]|jgi:RND family efflux transporter MFP subunit|nr:efflux RND transporter periplasmic adaptor subunit [Ignavibacteria bacterium]MCU7504878.1 efflux RND transporter periplasmic adaptor subunit [Ignavibacteria bacterium]MCU7517834.1 efflux RND transporter periplasmic adaptor subunit [Ignavibacteria bacterium]